jgi:hypothetical protein
MKVAATPKTAPYINPLINFMNENSSLHTSKNIGLSTFAIEGASRFTVDKRVILATEYLQSKIIR